MVHAQLSGMTQRLDLLTMYLIVAVFAALRSACTDPTDALVLLKSMQATPHAHNPLAQHSLIAHATPTGTPIDVLIAELQRHGAADIDCGMAYLLQGLLGVARARHVVCRLVDDTRRRERTVIAVESAGLCPVEPASAAPSSLVHLAHTTRTGRTFEFEFTLARPELGLDTPAVMLVMQAARRLLLWADLSHGPLHDKGPMAKHHRRVLLSMLRGLSEKQIAAELHLSINTAHQYVTQLYRRFGVRNRASLMAQWLADASH